MQYFVFGPSGSGKNTEAFDAFMMPAFSETSDDLVRDVFGNVGIDREKIEEYVGHKIRYKFISNDDIRDEENWPVLGDPDSEGGRDVIEGKLFTPGCLIIVDEARSIWRKNQDIPHRILKSLDTQRHFSTARGQGIDVVWIGQTKKQFHQDIRDNGEAYYKISPVEEMNLKDAHRLTIFSDWSCRRDDIVGSPSKIIHHNKSFYGMYYSVAQGVAGRQVLDKRIQHMRFMPKHYLRFIIGISLAAIAGIAIFVAFLAYQSRSVSKDLGKEVKNVSKLPPELSQGSSGNCNEPTLTIGGRVMVVRGVGPDAKVVDADGHCGTGEGRLLNGEGLFSQLGHVGR